MEFNDDLDGLERVVSNSTVMELYDKDGFPHFCISFLSIKDAELAHGYLRQLYLFWDQWPDFDFKGPH